MSSVSRALLNAVLAAVQIMMLDDTVIVVDNSNYKAEYAENVPFKAKVYCKDDKTITVVSLKTDKEYELYYNQVLEAMDIEDIVKLLDLSKYSS